MISSAVSPLRTALGVACDEVADAVDVEHEPLGRVGGRLAAKARDHAAIYARERTFLYPARPQERRRERVADRDRERVGGVVRRRQPRRARGSSSPSAASAPCRRGRSRRSPASRCAGAYSRQSSPALAAATSTAPRACPTESAMRASAPTYDSSSATASGSCSAMSSATASWIVFKRRTTSCPAGVDQQPCATSLRRPPLSWTIPYPQAAVPGSMPTTFTAESYGPGRTNPVRAATGCGRSNRAPR